MMLYSALALMLGHNFIGHHHHDFEQTEVSHHHNDGHHHDNDPEDNSDSENESDDWSHLFSGVQHYGAEELTFLTSHSSTDNLSKQIPQFIAIQVSNFVLNQIIVEVRQNAPPYISEYYNSQNFLPNGLRAPPIFIV